MRRNKRWATMLALVASLTVIAAACSSDDSTSGEPTESMAPAEDSDPAMTEETITDIVAGNEDFSTLLAAVQAADLGNTLDGEGPYTVFAPTNEAFAALPDGTVETLLKPKNQEQLAAILTYHVVPGEILAADVTSGEVTTVNGESFMVEATDGGVMITDGQGNEATVTSTDIVASNGVIHVIDGALVPAS